MTLSSIFVSQMSVKSTFICVNRNARPEVRLIGKERTPIIVLDDFADDICNIKQFACESAHFKEVKKKDSYYPGVRVNLPREYVRDVIVPINGLFYDLYKIPKSLKVSPANSVFSLLSTPPENLSVLQRIPHIDSVSPYLFAVLHYLAEGKHGSTGFFRHKSTGFERITSNRKDQYYSEVQNHFDRFGEPPEGYLVNSNEQYELYCSVDYKPNRLVIYPSNLLHSILVSKEFDLDSNPSTGRLTANIFLTYS